MTFLAAALRGFHVVRLRVDEIYAFLCDPACPHHPERMITPMPEDLDPVRRNWAADLPGETPAQARARADATIQRAAAKGNPLAQKLARKVDKDAAKGKHRNR